MSEKKILGLQVYLMKKIWVKIWGNLGRKNWNYLLLAHANITFIKKNFDQLVSGIKNNIDVLVI